VERLAEVDDPGALVALDAARAVPAHLPVERGLERVLDAQRAALEKKACGR
jgi:hypothetical protein